MRTLVLGGDGYLGWPTALHLSAAGHDVAIADNFARRGYDEELGATSLVPIAPLDRASRGLAARSRIARSGHSSGISPTLRSRRRSSMRFARRRSSISQNSVRRPIR